MEILWQAKSCSSWSSNLSSEKFWKLTVDAQPKDEAAAADKATGVTAGTILENGRAKELYAFKVVLDPSDNSKMILYPYATPVYTGANDIDIFGTKVMFEHRKYDK